MLDEVTLTRAFGACVGNQPADGVELVVAREDEVSRPGLPALLVLLLYLVNEVLDQVQHRGTARQYR